MREKNTLFPTCQVRVSRLYRVAFSSFSCSTAAPQPQVPDLSGHCRTSTASEVSLYRWALTQAPESQISVGTGRTSTTSAGPQPRAPDLNRHCWTSTATARFQWARPNLKCKLQIPVELKNCLASSRAEFYMKKPRQGQGLHFVKIMQFLFHGLCFWMGWLCLCEVVLINVTPPLIMLQFLTFILEVYEQR